MSVGEILALSATLAGKDGLAVDFRNNDVDYADEEVGKFFDAYNLTLSELNEEVEPLKNTETLTSENGVYPYTAFSKNVLEIVSVESGGKAVPFVARPEYLETNEREIVVNYVYAPEKATKTTDPCAYNDRLLSSRLIAKAVAAEFLLTAGLFEEAVALRSAFEDGVTARALKKKRAKIKRRVWA